MNNQKDLLTECIQAPEGSFGRVLFSSSIQSVFGGKQGKIRGQEMIDDWFVKQPRVLSGKTSND